MQPCWEDRPHVRRQDDLRWYAGGGNLSNFINFLWMDLLHTFHFLFPHFMVLTDSIVMFHPDFQGDLLRLCKRNKPSHGRYNGLYRRKGLKSNSNCNCYLSIVSLTPKLASWMAFLSCIFKSTYHLNTPKILFYFPRCPFANQWQVRNAPQQATHAVRRWSCLVINHLLRKEVAAIKLKLIK